MLRTKPYSIPDKVAELRELANKMMRENSDYALDIHALAIDITEGLNLDKEGKDNA